MVGLGLTAVGEWGQELNNKTLEFLFKINSVTTANKIIKMYISNSWLWHLDREKEQPFCIVKAHLSTYDTSCLVLDTLCPTLRGAWIS